MKYSKLYNRMREVGFYIRSINERLIDEEIILSNDNKEILSYLDSILEIASVARKEFLQEIQQ